LTQEKEVYDFSSIFGSVVRPNRKVREVGSLPILETVWDHLNFYGIAFSGCPIFGTES